jgi:Spy/CpxP family protein refolding chaperone
MTFHRLSSAVLAAYRMALAAALITTASAAADEPIDTREFHDGTHHWRHIRADNPIITPLADQVSYRAD